MTAGQSVDEIGELHVVVVVVPHAAFFARYVDAIAEVELGRVDAEVDVGHERAEHDDAVARLDVLGDFVATERTFVQAHVERVGFGDDAFAEHRGGHRDAGCLGQSHGFFLQAEAVNFDAEQQHRLARVFDSLHGFVDGFGECARIAVNFRLFVGRRCFGPHVDHVARDVDVHGPLVASAGGEHAIDFAERR